MVSVQENLLFPPPSHLLVLLFCIFIKDEENQTRLQGPEAIKSHIIAGN